MKLLINFKISIVKPLKFGNVKLISFHTLHTCPCRDSSWFMLTKGAPGLDQLGAIYCIQKMCIGLELCSVSYGSIPTVLPMSFTIVSQGLYSLRGEMSYRQISCSLEAARLDVMMVASLWNLPDISSALQSRRLSNFRAIGKFWTRIARLRGFTRFWNFASLRLVKRGPGFEHHFANARETIQRIWLKNSITKQNKAKQNLVPIYGI